jgi:hypothetical protein
MFEEIWFSAEARTARNARHAVRRCLAATDVRALEEVELLAGEVFAEAAALAQHSSRLCVRVRRTRGQVRVEVAHEPGDGWTHDDGRDPVDSVILERLLDAFAVRWGRTGETSGDSCTWFELTVVDELVTSIQLPESSRAALSARR